MDDGKQAAFKRCQEAKCEFSKAEGTQKVLSSLTQTHHLSHTEALRRGQTQDARPFPPSRWDLQPERASAGYCGIDRGFQKDSEAEIHQKFRLSALYF